MTNVLFVCLGNICRSPTAHGVYETLAAKSGLRGDVDGAGTGAWHSGEPPDMRAQSMALSRGYDLSHLRARQVVAQDFEKFDLILAMDRNNLSNLKAMQPIGSTAKIQLFLDYAPDQKLRQIPDPYYNDQFDLVLDLIEQASYGLIKKLS